MTQQFRSRLPPGAPPLLGAIVLMFFSVFIGVSIAPIAAETAGRSSDAGLVTGFIQNVSYLAMLDDVEPQSYGLVATLWNISLDGGVMVGALGLALLEQAASLAAVLWSLALIFIAVAPVAAMAARSTPTMNAGFRP